MTDRNLIWQSIFEKYNIYSHNFIVEPFEITEQQIREVVNLPLTSNLWKYDKREDRPRVFQQQNLFLLPVKHDAYVIVKGEGYVDIPLIEEIPRTHQSHLNFPLITSQVGDSEMQHLDFAYATSVIRTFMQDPTLVLTIRGRKYTPKFSFRVGRQRITVEGVQTEVDAGYEGENQVVLVEAKNSRANNTIIRQLYYPFRQWQQNLKDKKVDKTVSTIFFEKSGNEYFMWQFKFNDEDDYNAIELARSHRFQIIEPAN